MLGDRPGDREVEQHAPATEHEEPVAGLLDVGDDVGREEHGRTVGTHRVDQDVEELAARQRVKARQRFVEQEDRRPRPQRERQPDLRLLSPRQLVGARGERDREVVETAMGKRAVEAGTEVSARSTCSSTVSSR